MVGEDGSNSENLVYVHSDSVYEESYDKNTEEYTWTRTVISDGKEVTLTEVDDSGISLLAKNRMDEGKWYQVRYNADGEVIRVEAYNPNDYADDDAEQTDINAGWLDADWQYDNWSLSNTTGSDRYTNTLDDDSPVTGAANLFADPSVDTVLYHERFNDPLNQGLPTVDKARTLYEYNSTTSGIRIATDASIILDQERNNDGGDVYFGTGVDDLIDFLDDLHKNAAGQYDYELSLLIEDGRATTVIIKDKVPDGDDGNWTETNMVTNNDKSFRLWGDSNGANYDAEAEAIAYNRSTARVNYSFYVVDPADDEHYDGVQTFSYTLTVYSKGDLIDVMNGVETTSNANGLVADTFQLANDYEEVDIYVSNVEVVAPVVEEPETMTVVVRFKEDGNTLVAEETFEDETITVGSGLAVRVTADKLNAVGGLVPAGYAIADTFQPKYIYQDDPFVDVPVVKTATLNITLDEADFATNKVPATWSITDIDTPSGTLTVKENDTVTVTIQRVAGVYSYDPDVETQSESGCTVTDGTTVVTATTTATEQAVIVFSFTVNDITTAGGTLNIVLGTK